MATTTTRSNRVKRTFNLRPATAAVLKSLIDEHHVAPTQDALIERAIRDIERGIRDEICAQQYAKAALDPEYWREWREWELGTMADEYMDGAE